VEAFDANRRSGVYAHGIIRDAGSRHVGFRGIRWVFYSPLTTTSRRCDPAYCCSSSSIPRSHWPAMAVAADMFKEVPVPLTSTVLRRPSAIGMTVVARRSCRGSAAGHYGSPEGRKQNSPGLQAIRHARSFPNCRATCFCEFSPESSCSRSSSEFGARSGRRSPRRGYPTCAAYHLAQIPKLKIVLVLVVVLDLLGLCVETRPESSRTISFH
jgi:hypothetical protein